MELSLLLATFGSMLLAGLALDALGRLTSVPRITLLVLFGLVVGPAGIDLLPINPHDWHDIVAKLALTMIAFLLGGELSKATLTSHGRAIITVSLAVTLASPVTIGLGLAAVGVPVAMVLLLAGIGLAADPAATRDVVNGAGRTGPFAKTLLGVVAIDDAWGVIVFSVILGVVAEASGGIGAGLLGGVREVAGAIGLGLAVGLPAAFLTGRIAEGEPTLMEALGIVLLCAGLALHFEVSYLLAGMTAGVVVVNLAKHHEYPFHEIEHISTPFLVVFFVLAGATVDLAAFDQVGLLSAAFIGLRVAGRFVGGSAGAWAGCRRPRAIGSAWR